MTRTNRYTCGTCGGHIITVDRDEGVTPMFLNCRATPGCGGRMASEMYLVLDGEAPTHEWYRPTGKVKARDRDYVASGGLLIRPIATT